MLKSAKLSQSVIHLLFTLYVLATLVPFVLVFMVSITEEKTLYLNGYSLFPEKIDFSAYAYLWNGSNSILRAYLVTILVTAIGTAFGLFFTALYAYPISRKELPFRKALSFYIFFTMLFNGGLVPWYLVYTNLFDINDTLLALIVPNLLIGGFNILIMRTFFTATIPPSVIESASIDGAGELRIFFRMILPLSLPVMATLGLFVTLAYWNDWFNSLVFITNKDNFTIQYLLNKTLTDINVLLNYTTGSLQSQLLATVPTETIRMAVGVIGIGPIVLAYPFFQKYIVQGLTIGSVKG